MGRTVNTTSIQTKSAISRIKFFLALSRTPHALLDMATPALSAILWLGALPPLEVIGLGLLTAFSGYMSVYALNDIVDYQGDRQKIRGGSVTLNRDLDALFLLHPMAHGVLSYREGFFWMGGWALLALLGSFLLNPVCTLIFLIACLLEIVYCLLLKVSYLRGMISGVVKNSGGIAAVFAVDPNPSPIFLIVLFSWFFFWEIGGQNIPNDWMDLDEDRKLKAQTLPVHFGPERSIRIILSSLVLAAAMSMMMFWIPPGRLGGLYPVGALFCGFFLLFLPAVRLLKNKTPQEASSLFNRASYYPLAMLLVAVLSWKL